MSAWFDCIKERSASESPYVIAEVGSNYKSKEELLGSIALAKACGADAVKFQYFTRQELFGPRDELDRDFPLAALSEKAKACGIDFLCSAFSPAGVGVVDEFVPAHKIASSEMSHVGILHAVKETGKPVILSTGAWFALDIQRVLKALGDHPTVLMHCNVSYPTKYVDFPKFTMLRTMFSGPLGFSDHTTSIDAIPYVFKLAGATVFEKHFNPFDHKDTPDAPHSLNVNEFKAYCAILRGDSVDYTEENEARLKHCRRIIATRDILPGDTLREGDNIGIYRAQHEDARGENPFRIYELEGKVATKPVRMGEGVSIEDTI